MASITLSIEQVHPNASHVIVAAYVRTSTLYDVKMPVIGTLLEKFHNAITPSTSQYAKYKFSGAQETGRGADATDTKLIFIPPADPTPNPVYSQEFERDPITHDIWDVRRQISVAPAYAESPAGEVSTSEQMPNGLWINTTKTISLPGRVQTTLKDTDELGLITTTQQYVTNAVGVAAVAAATGYNIEAEYKDVNDAFGLLTLVNIESTSKTDIEYDPETWCKITTVRTISDTQLTTQAAGTEVNSKQIGNGLFLNVVRTIDDTCIDAGYSLPRSVPFDIPRILTDLEFAVGTDGLSLTVNPIARGGYRRQLAGTLEVSFTDTVPTPGTVFQIIPRRIQYDGTYFNLPFGDMVTDAWTNVGSTGGTFTETVSWAASVPSTTDYLAQIGDSVLFTEDTTKWRFQKYRTARQYVTLE